MEQYEYLKEIADKYYSVFYKQGFATAGNNGPHGHKDTPVRNTSHFLVIYSYLYKITKEKKYIEICEKFARYICDEAKKSKNGSIQCMDTDKFNHLNGLIGQGWAIEALLYYFDISQNMECFEIAKKIFYSQKYDFNKHLFNMVELNGKDIGVDITYNHNIWFIACASKILDYEKDETLKKIIIDMLENGTKRDFKIYNSGLLHHYVSYKIPAKVKIKKIIKILLSPIKKINPRKFDYKYMEEAYHVFDMYGFCILEQKFSDLEFFNSHKYLKAKKYALNINNLNKKYNVENAIKNCNENFNIYSYAYNTLTFEYPFVSLMFKEEDMNVYSKLYKIQEKLMYDENSGEFSKFNPDINTFNARTYEIIRYLEMKMEEK